MCQDSLADRSDPRVPKGLCKEADQVIKKTVITVHMDIIQAKVKENRISQVTRYCSGRN